MPLVRYRADKFHLHSGGESHFLLDCECLQYNDLRNIAKIILHKYYPKRVVSIPKGGDRLADVLESLLRSSRPEPGSEVIDVLIVDDVLTTGASMQEAWMKLAVDGIRLKDMDPPAPTIKGAVIFQRGPDMNGVFAVFKTADWD